jgi:hypothetical protein
MKLNFKPQGTGGNFSPLACYHKNIQVLVGNLNGQPPEDGEEYQICFYKMNELDEFEDEPFLMKNYKKFKKFQMIERVERYLTKHLYGTKKIHVNQHNIKANIKGANLPVITIKGEDGSNLYCHEVEILGPSRVVYGADNPLNCGARVWVETEAEIKIKK